MSSLEAWVCPSCHRLVPKSVEVCRCGHRATGVEEPAAFAAPAAPAPDVVAVPARASLAPWLALGLLVAGGAAALLIWRPATPSSDRGPAPLASSPTADRRRADATAQPADPAAPAWPSDSTLWREPAPPTPVPAVAAGAAPPERTAPRSLEDVVSAVLPGVVLVETTEARGTGFFVTTDTVVTNAHVVEGATYVTLRLAGGLELPATVTARSTEMDLAAIHVARAPVGQVTLPLGTSASVRVGQEVVAIGSPLGLQNTVTRGIVSSLRRLGALTLVQTDAAINPGNSGGPLVDRDGRVIAVATLKLQGQAEALGFGVAAEHVRAFLAGGTSTSGSAGRRPVDVMNDGAQGGAGPDDEREAATRGYEQFMADAAKRAAQLDRYWSEIVTQCLGGTTPPTRGERGWYALWDRFDDSRVSPGCSQYFADFRRAVATFHERMNEAADEARRAGMYPGVARDIRHRYSLDSPEW